MAKVTFIGHLAVDIIDANNYIGGGGVFYGACALKAVRPDIEVEIITKIPDKWLYLFNEAIDIGITIKNFSCETATMFENIYPTSNPDDRISLCCTTAPQWVKSDLIGIYSDAIVISPLWSPEFPEDLIKDMRSKCNYLIVDIQGFTRQISEDFKISQIDWKNKERFLKHFDLIKLDNKEAFCLTNIEDTETALESIAAHCPLSSLICTYHAGILLQSGNKCINSLFGEYTINGRTGRGDTVTAIATSFLIENGTISQENLDRTAKLTTIKMQHKGVLKNKYI